MKLKKVITRRNLTIVFTFSLAVTLLHAAYFLWNVNAINKDILKQNQRQIDIFNVVVDKCLRRADTLIYCLSDVKFADYLQDRNALKQILVNVLQIYPEIDGAGVAFNPEWIKNKFEGGEEFSSQENPLFSAYLIRDTADMIKESKLDYDYTDTSLLTACWYTEIVSKQKPGWVGPYFGEAAQMQCVDYGKPMYDSDGDLVCIVLATYSLIMFRSCAADSITRENGYSFLLSKDGTFLYHPRQELMDGKTTMRDVGELSGNPVLIACSDSIDNQVQYGRMHYSSIYTKEKTMLLYQRLDHLGWYLVTIVPDIIGRPLCSFPEKIFLGLLASVLLLCMALGIVAWGRLWTISIGLSIIFTLGTIFICFLSVKRYESGLCNSVIEMMKNKKDGDDAEKCGRTALENRYASEAYLSTCFNDSMKTIPTGIVVQTVNFTGTNSFSMSGYLWQKYTSREDTVILGIEFPENEEEEFYFAYDDSLGRNTYVRGWRFFAIIRQPFGYRKYPLDKEELWLRMRPKGLNQEIRLVPDFDAYHADSAFLMGLDQNMTLPQWTIMNTNYSYDVNYTPSTYGKGLCETCGQNLEMYFSLHVRRNILDAFISQFIPLLVILLMLFSILWMGRKTDRDGLLGFNSLAGTSACTALFFTVIYNHISLRNALGSPGVVYMEYYFFVTYLAILMVSVNSILVAIDNKSVLINHNDNVLSRLLYWPIITGTLFAVTFGEFV